MSVFEYIDRDKVIGFLLHSWWGPLHDWPLGIMEEVFFIHDVMRHYRRSLRDWDIGMRQPARLEHSVALLHQRGAQRSDQFGSDFALTIDVTGPITFRKTALFQTKLATNYFATVESHQLQEALSVSEFVGRCFTMAVDRTRCVIRIESFDVLASSFNTGQATKTFDTTQWHPSTVWMSNWFECQHGLPSSSIGGPQIESLLSAYLVERPVYFPEFGVATNVNRDLPFVPKSWHYAKITIGENA